MEGELLAFLAAEGRGQGHMKLSESFRMGAIKATDNALWWREWVK